MKQYMWYHPLYILETHAQTIIGHMDNAEKYDYTLLKEDELHRVRKNDHLTIVGHSTPPKSLANQGSDSDIDDELDDSGNYIQGEKVRQFVQRLQDAGLKEAPQILSLECCKAAVENGIAAQLSSHPFFSSTIIEANTSSVGRKNGLFTCSLILDDYGRMVINFKANPWFFFLSGQPILRLDHGTYGLQNILGQILGQKHCADSYNFFSRNRLKSSITADSKEEQDMDNEFKVISQFNS